MSGPFVASAIGNPDWGWLSSYAEGRTPDVGRCCQEPGDELLQQFLDDPNTLMLVVNQHSNFNHPKIMTLPRGLPTRWEHNERVVFDSLRLAPKRTSKKRLVVAASSSWGARPQILAGLRKRLGVDLEMMDVRALAQQPTDRKGRLNRCCRLSVILWPFLFLSFSHGIHTTLQICVLREVSLCQVWCGPARRRVRLPSYMGNANYGERRNVFYLHICDFLRNL